MSGSIYTAYLSRLESYLTNFLYRNAMFDESEKPGRIESQFRHELGAINPYLCLADSAVGLLLKEVETKPDKASFLKRLTAKQGHHNLYTEHLDMNELRKFVHLAHIAFINSKAEEACARIQKIKVMLSEAKENAEGDFLRRTIAIVHSSKEGDCKLAKNLNSKTLEDYIEKIDLEVLDYFRLIRNTNFHYSKEENSDKILKIFNSIDQNLLKNKYKLGLSNPEKIDSKDVLLLSKVWQSSIKQICRKCLNKENLYEEIQRTYKGISNEQRRKNKIIQALKQDFLQTDEEIGIIMSTSNSDRGR